MQWVQFTAVGTTEIVNWILYVVIPFKVPFIQFAFSATREFYSMQKGACNSISRHTNEGRLYIQEERIEMQQQHEKIKKKCNYLQNRKVILSRDVPGQKSLSRDFCSCPCPGTKGHRDKKISLSRDKGTTGRPAGRPVPWKR